MVGRIAAGHPLTEAATRGAALRVFTGAPMPEGPDTVFMQEDCEVSGLEPGDTRTVVLPPGIKRGSNYRFAGEDIEAGSTVLRTGRRLRPRDIGLAASIGCDRLAVRQPLRVALFSTGDEVHEPGTPAAPGCIYDANRHALAALLRGLGCAVTDLGIQQDRRDAVLGFVSRWVRGLAANVEALRVIALEVGDTSDLPATAGNAADEYTLYDQ